MQTMPSRARRRVYGAVWLAAIAGVVGLGVADYQEAFTPVVRVTLVTSQAGLLTDPGADVRLRGVPVGKVRSVEYDASGARLELALDPAQVSKIPADVTADIAPNTVFGPKSVLLSPAESSASARSLREGDVVQTKRVTTEINDVFNELEDVLTTVKPSQVSSTLGAMAQALDGRGEKLGRYISQLNDYLEKFNPHLGTLRQAVTESADVTHLYADVMPEFVELAKNLSITSDTLTEQQAALHAMLVDLTRTADNGADFMAHAGPPLVTAVDALEPTTRLLAKYSPEFTCLVEGLDEARRRTEMALGRDLPGVQAEISFLPGQRGYRYPDDLPKLVTGVGPQCYGLPYISPKEHISPFKLYDDGAIAYGPGSDAGTINPRGAQVYPELFGPFADDLLKNLNGAGGPR